MEMKKSEVLDRYMILSMKVGYDPGLLSVFKEYESAASMVIGKLCRRGGLSEIMKLMEANAKIWMLEATIRNEFKNDPDNKGIELSFDKIGRAAVSIRNYNNIRVKAKEAIDLILEQVPEPKIDHASCEPAGIIADDTTKDAIRDMLGEAMGG